MKISVFISIILLVTNSCNRENAIQKETQKNFSSHKQYIREISFEGKILDKKYCNQCNFNKYQIKIEFNKAITEKIELTNLSFLPYYSFASNEEITLSVTKELYEASEKGNLVKKQSGSSNLLITDKDYKLLSEEIYKWIP